MAGFKLYEVTNQIIENQHEEVSTDQLDALTVAFDHKAIGCAIVTKNLNAEISAIESEIKRLQDLKAVRQNNVDRLKAYIMACMKGAGISKVENGVHQIRIQKSPLSITVTDTDAVPVEFKTEVIEVKVDRRAIADQIKSTGVIPDGVDAKQNDHLRIS
jgi:translation elongation factor EF-1beta